ncbi:PREDICTED: uncharacterized protein LOC104825938 [Tarenaya hassleriana]|uniref:uncharacterized protein LOC104825938 n=1 Tax=Tarenaya hassleriana TaxID=28532 RepID=UPI00053C5DF5|nr:PREDICTED: uncharacterized protein LOC104825938 [Tarenaya hassleriana]
MASITVATLIYALSRRTYYSVLRPRLYICWIVLFAVQACIDLGLRVTMSVNSDTGSFFVSQERLVDDTSGRRKALWRWKLRDEAEGQAELKDKLLIDLEVFNFLNWWIYCLCFVIGIVKILGLFSWVRDGVLASKRTRKNYESMEEDSV